MLPYQNHLLKAYQRHAPKYKKSSFIVEKMGQHLLARLAYFRYPPQKICDLGAGQGLDAQLLAQCYTGAEIIAVDFSLSQLQHIKPISENTFLCAAHASYLPLSAGYFDLVFANLLLPAIIDYHTLWQEILRILKPGGTFLFSSLGPKTLIELKTCFEELEHRDAINIFPDMHDLGDSLIQAGFKDPVIDAEKLELHYSNLNKLLHELKALGSIKIWGNYHSVYSSRQFWKQCEKKYREHFSVDSLKLPVTVEPYYAIAFAPTQKVATAHESQTIEIPLASLKRKK